jgi:hypothetical protein
MRGRSRTICRRRGATGLAVVFLAAVAVLVVCSPATAPRPRTTPANAALLATRQDGGDGCARAVALHDLALTRILARHRAAAAGAAEVAAPAGAAHRTRMHHAVALSAQGALGVATLAALAAIVLVVAAIIAGEHRQVARRRRGETASHPATAPGRPAAN